MNMPTALPGGLLIFEEVKVMDKKERMTLVYLLPRPLPIGPTRPGVPRR